MGDTKQGTGCTFTHEHKAAKQTQSPAQTMVMYYMSEQILRRDVILQ